MKNDLDIVQVIIVEGKTDTQKLRKIFGPKIETIETKGLSLDEKTINLIKKVNEYQGIIIFTDPDGPGKKIRQILNEKLDGDVINAFITKADIKKPAKKIGIAEADDEAIYQALSSVVKFNKQKTSLSWKDYLENDFYLKANRKIICQNFGFDENISSKSLFKWLNWMGLTKKNVLKILDQWKEKENE